MSLVIKAWKINSHPAAGDSYAQVIARQSGLISFLLSLLGIDATSTLIVSSQGFEFERGSLSGFLRRVTPFDHVSSVLYGRFKPWKKTVFFVFLSMSLGISLLGGSTGQTVLGTLVLFGGVALSLLYYFLNRQLTIAFAEDSGQEFGITFKRSIVEGQEIDEQSLKRLVVIIEALLRGQAAALEPVSAGGSPGGVRSSATAPTNLRELVGDGGPRGSVIPPIQTRPTMAPVCSACKAPLTPGDMFCNSCGARVPPSPDAGAAGAAR